MPGEWIGSNEGSFYLIMQPTGELQLLQYQGVESVCRIGINGTQIGGSLANAVFEISPDPSLIGKIGYVDVDGKLNEYPSSFIGYNDTYVKQTGYKIDSSDLGTPPSDSVEQCKTYCNSKSNCVGFTYLDNVCNLTSETFPTIPKIPNNNAEYYSRNPQINGIDPTCGSKGVENVDENTWNSYPNSGKMMSSDMKCKIDLINADTQKLLTSNQNTMDTTYSPIPQNISNLRSQTNDIYKQINSNTEKVNQNLTKIDEINNKTNIDTSTFNRMFSYSGSSVIQTNYGYILWTVFILILLIVIIGIVKKL
jgi:hypothetical protein